MDLNTLDLYTLIGFGGVAFYVGSYALVQAGRVNGNGAVYTLMNVAAASLVLVSLFDDFNLPSMVTQITWIALGIGGLSLRSWRQLKGDKQTTIDLTDQHGEDPHPQIPQLDDAPAAEPAGAAIALSPDDAQLVDPMTFDPQSESAAVRVHPQRQNDDSNDRVFDLRPDKAPASAYVIRLGLKPDLAPSS